MSAELEFESGLEADFLRRLDVCPEVAGIREQPLWIDFDDHGTFSRYCPDFLVSMSNGEQFLVEVKPVWLMALHRNWSKWGAMRAFAAHHGCGMLITDGRTTFTEVRKHVPPAAFVEAVLNSLSGGPIDWSRYHRIKQEHSPTAFDFTAMVIRHRLAWQLSPFHLRSDSTLARNEA
jgi:hypothetical protein